MVKSFSKSKRTPVRLRHKIEKASAAKQRKQRKEAKKNPQWKSKLKKDPGIPNLLPFKEKILEEIEERKRAKAEKAEKARDARQSKAALSSATVDADVMDEDDDLNEDESSSDADAMSQDELADTEQSNPMAALLASAQARAVEFGGDLKGDISDSDSEQDEAEPGVHLSLHHGTDHRNPDVSRKMFDKVFKQVLETADVILYVLDARDPDGTRSREVERQILAAEAGSKRLILVLNKIDLVPSPVLQGWLTHLRRYFPTIPLRASTPASNAETFDHKSFTIKNTSETLLKALKSYAASKQLKRSISVGVIGYPNVGKSSVINALTSQRSKSQSGSGACPVGAEAGVTTAMRVIKIDSKLKILDSPGIVFPSAVDGVGGPATGKNKADHEARLILLNALPPSQISDPVPAVSLLLSRLSQTETLYSKLLQSYGIIALGPFNKADLVTDFLVQVARKRGRLGKGGVPNLTAAAMTVVTDWRDGRLQGWIEPPVLKVTDDIDMAAGPNVNHEQLGADRKEIVKEWAAEFKLEGLWGDEPGDQK